MLNVKLKKEHSNDEYTGFCPYIPQESHPFTIYYIDNDETKFITTSQVQNVYYKDNIFLFITKNAVYNLELLDNVVNPLSFGRKHFISET